MDGQFTEKENKALDVPVRCYFIPTRLAKSLKSDNRRVGDEVMKYKLLHIPSGRAK